MSLGILAVNQTIIVLETKQISMSFSCFCIMIPCRLQYNYANLALYLEPNLDYVVDSKMQTKKEFY